MNPITRIVVFAVGLILAGVVIQVVYRKLTGKAFFQYHPEGLGHPVSLAALQGEWRMLECGRRGNFAPIEEIALANVVMEISGDRFSMIKSGEGERIRVDDAVFPTKLDLIDDRGEVTPCIARFIGDQLEMCQAEPGDNRPSDFSRSRRNEATVVRFYKIQNPSEG